jgi:hypothetical protein
VANPLEVVQYSQSLMLIIAIIVVQLSEFSVRNVEEWLDEIESKYQHKKDWLDRCGRQVQSKQGEQHQEDERGSVPQEENTLSKQEEIYVPPCQTGYQVSPSLLILLKA